MVVGKPFGWVGGYFPGEEPLVETRLFLGRDPGRRRVCACFTGGAARAHSLGEGLKDTGMGRSVRRVGMRAHTALGSEAVFEGLRQGC